MSPAVQTLPEAPESRLHLGSGFLGLALILHGLIHLMGVMLLLQLGEPGDLTYAMARPEPGTPLAILFAGLWALAAGLFVASGYSILRSRLRSRLLTAASVVSLIAIAPVASSAPVGLAISGMALLGSFVTARRMG